MGVARTACSAVAAAPVYSIHITIRMVILSCFGLRLRPEGAKRPNALAPNVPCSGVCVLMRAPLGREAGRAPLHVPGIGLQLGFFGLRLRLT